MLDALSELASINSQSSSRLREILEVLGINSSTVSGPEKSVAFGSAYFAAFHPQDACLRFPPLTVRFFQDAVKFNVLNNREAQEISFKMAACCRMLRDEYKGAFSTVLHNGVFKDFLSNGLSLNEFLHKESVHGWCVDAFAAAFPWPVMPEIHLRAPGYRPAILSRSTILKAAPGPFLRFMTAVDIAVLGAWTGFSVSDISQGLSWLQASAGSESDDVVLRPSGGAEHIVMPVFSYGFQGAVFGAFNGLSAAQKEEILKTLVQFGQSLADTYAYLRRNECLQMMQRGRDASSVASALLRVVSPVEHLVVEMKGRVHGYSLEKEDGYWAGYREQRGQTASDLCRELKFEGKSSKVELSFMGDQFRVTVKPLGDQPGLDPVFTWMSLHARLSEILYVPGQVHGSDPLTQGMLSSLKETLESRISRIGQDGADKSRGDFGRLKRLCIVELIVENFDRGEIEITNHSLKSRLERKLGPRASMKLNGYQIAGRALQRVKNEFNEDFKRCVTFDPVGPNKVRLSWTPK
jgi:hypothetical protein